MNNPMNELAFRPTPPEKCLLGFGLPLTKETFFKDRLTKTDKDFAKNFKKALNAQLAWEEYDEHVVRQANKVMDFARKAGVYVIPDFTLGDIKYATDFEVVTIIGHQVNKTEKVELADGTHSVNEFVSAIPSNTECMLDLTICKSIILLNEIKKRFGGNMIVLGNAMPVSLQICLLVYELTIQKILVNKNLNYLDAITLVKKEIINNL